MKRFVVFTVTGYVLKSGSGVPQIVYHVADRLYNYRVVHQSQPWSPGWYADKARDKAGAVAAELEERLAA